MSAKMSDALRVQEIFDVVTQTLEQLGVIGLTRARFVNPVGAADELIVEGLVNRVLRVTEEGGKLSAPFAAYGFEMREMSGLRNRLAHAYGTIDKEIIWQVLEDEFPKIVQACERYADENNLYLVRTWEASEGASEGEEQGL